MAALRSKPSNALSEGIEKCCDRYLPSLPGREETTAEATPETAVEPIIMAVGWEEPEEQDPENPMNWSAVAKWTNILTISVISFLV
jgi:hypothetical protein